MKISSIKSNIYFNPEIHRALRQRATNSQTSMSSLVNEAVRQMMHEDQKDLAAFTQRAAESEISLKALLANLKRHGKL
ncbi:MAG: CopG family transcriptional regulator [Burkholderiales bacterium]|nr:CopG family transcriptional regulator [Burkholderiales bacterium]